ncbi:MAG TPA: PPOX class F420-dependent oxidoreductase [Intrasporangium sp.]|uniref:PPOX class F420-dependent oxidoreductase n=1 Tax=Intrasporangium sp. TaxID=1925024 RepID=UPI002D799D3B|nr:PPOX class F420-dependent oxidoreductase [Intrasporangium sp.]HET7397597.1 PPOX class F420-dependent oxidoreductase [Intrasporangium sp.]
MDPEHLNALAALAEQRYVSLTTFRRDGAPVSSPVWVARDGDELVVITVDDVGKTKRLAHTARVELRPSDIRGAVSQGAPTYAGTARVVRDPAGVEAVKRAISAKYPMARLGNTAERLLGPVMRRKPRAGIRITLS